MVTNFGESNILRNHLFVNLFFMIWLALFICRNGRFYVNRNVSVLFKETVHMQNFIDRARHLLCKIRYIYIFSLWHWTWIKYVQCVVCGSRAHFFTLGLVILLFWFVYICCGFFCLIAFLPIFLTLFSF